jgi:type I site-specific restriction endonuclease
MLNNSLKNQTKNTYKSTASSDRKSRIGQKIIVTEIAKTIFSEEGTILVAEIPTGTGKKTCRTSWPSQA